MTFFYKSVERPFYVSSNNQPAYWNSTCLITAFPCWKCPGEIAVRAHLSLPREFLGRSLSESWEMHLCGHATSHSFERLCKIGHLIAIVFCPMISPPKKIVVTFFNDLRAAFSTSLSWSSNFTSYFNSRTWGSTNTPSLILSSLNPGNLFFKYINPALFWSIALTKFLMSPSSMCNGGK